MEQKNNDTGNRKHSRLDDLKGLVPGRTDRNLFSDSHQEAPIDDDAPMSANFSTDAGDETYEDEDMGGRSYYEKRAGNNVRK